MDIFSPEYRKAAQAIFSDPPQQWTTTPPTEPGWYWAWLGKNDDGEPFKPDMIYVNNNGMGEQHSPDDGNWDLGTWTHWLGPLPVPEPPK